MNTKDNLEGWIDLFESDPTSEKKMHDAMSRKHLAAAKEIADKIMASNPKSREEMTNHPLWTQYKGNYEAAIAHARKSNSIKESLFESEMPDRLNLILNAATKVLSGSLLTNQEREEIAHA